MPTAPRARPPLVILLAFGAFIAGGCTGYAPSGSPAATDLGALGCEVGPAPGFDVREGDPLRSGEPMAGTAIQAMTPRQVGDTARGRGLFVTWRYEYATGPQQGFSECWCIPPEDGRVTSVAYGIAGELVVSVDSGQTVSGPRAQPPRGWGC